MRYAIVIEQAGDSAGHRVSSGWFKADQLPVRRFPVA